MNICAAQTHPYKGDIAANIKQHRLFIEKAAALNVDILVFPELSLTGYEPQLAAGLATSIDDNRFAELQVLSDRFEMVITAGIPLRMPAGICIAMLIFQPYKTMRYYSKHYLHRDEEAFFIAGDSTFLYALKGVNVAPAICYEVFVPQHARAAREKGAALYLASVAKSAAGVDQANDHLSGIARDLQVPVLMANCTGPCDNFESSGQSAAWDSRGHLLGKLNDNKQGLLILDTETSNISRIKM